MKMLHCLDSPEMTVLERQRTRLKWHQHDTFFNGGGTGGVNFTSFLTTAGNLMGLGEVVDVPPSSMVKPDPALRIDQYWGQFGSSSSSSGFEMNLNGTISRTASCPPTVAAAAAMVAKAGADSASLLERKSFKKRKPESAALNKQDEEEEESKEKKKVKGSNEEMESKITAQSNSNNNNNVGSKTKNKKETSATTSKDNNSKASDVQKPDFIHVRARRGQATDSHSLAERVRREKISERMKFLQDLVPGCNRITGKAGMLDEIINYVQSLQRQVEFLSMKLATVNPRLDFDVDNLFAKDMIPNGSMPFPEIDMAPDMSNPFQFNPLQQHPISGLEMGLNLDMGLRRTTSAPVPETFIDSYPQLQLPTPWDNDLLSLYNLDFHQERATSFSSQQQFADGVDTSNLKMEM